MDLVDRLEAFARDTAGAETWETRPELLLAEAAGELRRLRSLLHDVASCGVAFEDPRLSYVEVQVDVDTWREVRATELSEDAR